MGIKTYQEKNANPMKKDLAQSDSPVWRKIQKNIQNVIFLENCIFGWFWGFFSKLVSPIELILSSLVLYFSPDRFWYPYIKFTLILIFDPYIVIFKIFRPHVRGVKQTFWQKSKFTPSFKHKTTPKTACYLTTSN